jgi:hypothetical protein
MAENAPFAVAAIELLSDLPVPRDADVSMAELRPAKKAGRRSPTRLRFLFAIRIPRDYPDGLNQFQ